MKDHRDTLISDLADIEAYLRERNRSLELLFRGALRSAIEAHHRLDRERELRLNAQRELRDLRERILVSQEAA
jgi:hypothetical protein